VLVHRLRNALEDLREVAAAEIRDQNADEAGVLRRVRRVRRCQGVAGAAIGSSTEIVVPRPGGLSSANRPPSASTRSPSPVSPDPVSATAPPTPSSEILACMTASSAVTATETEAASECLIAFVSASDTM